MRSKIPIGPALVTGLPKPLWGPAPQAQPKSVGTCMVYAQRRLGTEWPTPGWSNDKERVVRSLMLGYEMVKMTIEPDP